MLNIEQLKASTFIHLANLVSQYGDKSFTVADKNSTHQTCLSYRYIKPIGNGWNGREYVVSPDVIPIVKQLLSRLNRVS